jgi:hypothetical protein
MKKLLRGCLLAVAMGVLIVNVASADPIKVTITLDSTFALGSRFDADSSVASVGFRVPWGQDYFLYVAPQDTGSVEGADTLIFALQKAVDVGSTEPELLERARKWVNSYAFAAATNQGSAFPITKYIPYDSLAVYPMGGIMRWICYEGSTEDATDAIGSKTIFNCYLETDGED